MIFYLNCLVVDLTLYVVLQMKVTEIFEVTEAEAQKLAQVETKDSQVDLIGWLEHQEQQIQSGESSQD